MFPRNIFVFMQIKARSKEGRESKTLTVNWAPSVRGIFILDTKTKKNVVVENNKAEVKCEFQLGQPAANPSNVSTAIGEYACSRSHGQKE